MDESPTLYAAWVNSGEYPSCISIGTKIGAKRAHFADAEPTNRLINAARNMIPVMVTGPPKLSIFKKRAPFMAKSAPRLEVAKALINN